MSKQQHTPGNWVIRGREIGVRDTSDTQSYGMMLTICQVDEWDFKEHWQANASLIAAAPELLEALEEMIAWANCAPGTYPGGYPGTKAAQAIARAKGEQA